jgi:thiol:disulfide interchange protein
MNREFNTSSKQARSIFAVVAILATVLVLASIDGLSQHYAAEAQLASAKPVSLAQR